MHLSLQTAAIGPGGVEILVVIVLLKLLQWKLRIDSIELVIYCMGVVPCINNSHLSSWNGQFAIFSILPSACTEYFNIKSN